MRGLPLFASFAHCSKGDAAKQMAPQQEREAQDRDEEQRRCGGDAGQS